MSLGQIVRAILGPLTDPVARIYRSYYVDLGGFARTIADLPGVSTILEIGCGDGHLCQALAEQSSDTVILGIDPGVEPGALYRGRTQGVEFRPIEASTLLETEKNTFDLVVLCDVLHHVPPEGRGRLVDTAWALTGDGGYLAVKDWVSTKNLATALAYLSDRFITGDTPRFFEDRQGLDELISAHSPGGVVAGVGSVPPHPNNRYLIVSKP